MTPARVRQPSPSNPITEALGYLYIGYWDCKFFLRILIAARIAPVVLGICIFMEALGAILHVLGLMGHSETPGAPAHLWIQALTYVDPYLPIPLLLAAVITIYHHRRLEIRVKRHQVLLRSIAEVSSSAAHNDRAAAPAAREREARRHVAQILRSVVTALEFENNRRNGQPFSASVLIRNGRDVPFHIFEQYPKEIFSEDVALDSVNSVAAAAASEKTGNVVYVPNTRFDHGVRIADEEKRNNNRIRRTQTTRIMPGIYQRLRPAQCDPRRLKALICAHVPIETRADGRKENQVEVVVSFGAPRPDCMGELDFNAAKVAAALIGRAISRMF